MTDYIYDRHTLWSPVSISDQITSFIALSVKQLAETMKFFSDTSMSVYQAIATPSAMGTTAICHSKQRIQVENMEGFSAKGCACIV